MTAFAARSAWAWLDGARGVLVLVGVPAEVVVLLLLRVAELEVRRPEQRLVFVDGVGRAVDVCDQIAARAVTIPVLHGELADALLGAQARAALRLADLRQGAVHDALPRTQGGNGGVAHCFLLRRFSCESDGIVDRESGTICAVCGQKAGEMSAERPKPTATLI